MHGRKCKFANVVTEGALAQSRGVTLWRASHLSLNPNVPLIWLFVVRLLISKTLAQNAAADPPGTNSVSVKMKVFSTSNPTAMMSIAFCLAYRRVSSRVSFGECKNFSSSVNIMTKGTLKTSCKYLFNFSSKTYIQTFRRTW